MRLVSILGCLIAALLALLPAALRADSLTPVPGSFRALEFGPVIQGMSKSVAYREPSAAVWVFTGDRGAEVRLEFTALPTSLTGGASALEISYGAVDAAWNTVDDPGSAIPFDPVVGTVAYLAPDNGNIYIWLGATALPTASQRAGLYSDPFTVDVSYTGN
jgi:hypothetical protein